MARANGLWHSRRKLAAMCISMVFFILAIDYRKRRMIALEEYKRKNVKSDFMEDVDYVLETMRYMNDIQRGKAEIRDVVEKEQPVIEYYWWCRMDRYQSISTDEWTENDGLFLYSAYLDTRSNSLYPQNSAIQVLTVSFRTLRHKVYCNIYDEKRYAVVEGYVREIWQRAWDPRDHFYIPNLVTCPIPRRFDSSTKLLVSISSKPCSAQRVAMRVRVTKQVGEKEAVAVCVKGMDFQKPGIIDFRVPSVTDGEIMLKQRPFENTFRDDRMGGDLYAEDVSLRLVEWLEAQYLLGVSTVTTYVNTVPKRVQKVLDHYGKLGKLEQIPLTLPGHSPNLPLVRSQYIARNRQQKRRHELIPYNDCLYRHISTHRYILILDIDELIVPMEHNDYFELLKMIERGTPADRITSLSFANVFKFPTKSVNQSIPEHLYMLRNSHRSRKTSNPRNYGKSMTSTANVATVFNHFALHRLSPNVTGTIYVPEKLGVKLHYKAACPIEARKECDELQTDTVIDHSIDRFASELERRMNRTLSELKLL